jgi:hypothetical protein
MVRFRAIASRSRRGARSQVSRYVIECLNGGAQLGRVETDRPTQGQTVASNFRWWYPRVHTGTSSYVRGRKRGHPPPSQPRSGYSFPLRASSSPLPSSFFPRFSLSLSLSLSRLLFPSLSSTNARQPTATARDSESRVRARLEPELDWRDQLAFARPRKVSFPREFMHPKRSPRSRMSRPCAGPVLERRVQQSPPPLFPRVSLRELACRFAWRRSAVREIGIRKCYNLEEFALFQFPPPRYEVALRRANALHKPRGAVKRRRRRIVGE